MARICPKCGSDDVNVVDYMGSKCILCNSCGFDETEILEQYPEEKVNQKEKGNYNIYKTGGGRRV